MARFTLKGLCFVEQPTSGVQCVVRILQFPMEGRFNAYGVVVRRTIAGDVVVAAVIQLARRYLEFRYVL